MVLCGHCHCYLEAEARRSRRTCLRSHDVFVCSCSYSKVPQTGGLKQQSLISHSSAVWDVQGQGAGRFSVWRETSPWSWMATLPCCPHLAFPWCELRKRALPSPPLPIRPPIPSRGPHLQTPPHRGLGLPHVNSGEGHWLALHGTEGVPPCLPQEQGLHLPALLWASPECRQLGGDSLTCQQINGKGVPE